MNFVLFVALILIVGVVEIFADISLKQWANGLSADGSENDQQRQFQRMLAECPSMLTAKKPEKDGPLEK